ITVAPPRPIRLRSARNTLQPARAASTAAYMPAPPDPMIRTSVSTCMGSTLMPALHAGIIAQRARTSGRSAERGGFALARGDLHRVDDLGIGRAAAEIAGKIVPDLLVVGIGARAQQIEFALQQLDKVVVRLNLGGDWLAVESERDRARHHSSSSGLPALTRSARNTASGLSGSSLSRTPQASSMALAIAGDTQKVAVSPTPLAPNGPFGCGTPIGSFSITAGTSKIPGIL